MGVLERYEIRVSKTTTDANLPHSITCVIDVVVTTPIVPGPRRMGIHSMYACAAAVKRTSTGPSSRSQPAARFSESGDVSLAGQTG